MTLFDKMTTIGVILFLIAWLGHACIWVYFLNVSYGLPISKMILRPWRLLCGVMILFGYPIYLEILLRRATAFAGDKTETESHDLLFWGYDLVCLFFGGMIFPIITILRLRGRMPESVVNHQSRLLPLWETHGASLIGNGPWRHLARLPFNDPFTVEFTDLTLKLPVMPAAWDGLTILFLSDFHFYGSPSQNYFDAILKEIESQPMPDIVALGGDYLDAMQYHAWLAPLLRRLKWKEAAFAILGNHDHKYAPEKLRETFRSLGFTVLSNIWNEMTIRGERCVVIGDESPWNRPGPDLANAPKDCFRLCFSHTPDNFSSGMAEVELMISGHTHGGQIRLPVIGSIFVPCVTSRQYDQGVFQMLNSVLVVGRGLGGKEPLRFRCRPQVLRIKLTRG